eukprot:scaffold4399_cov175-Ochromonas_danica.AAC.24
MLEQNESVKTAIILANKLVQEREAAYQLYAPALKTFTSSLNDDEIYGFLDEMISIGCDVDVETFKTLGNSYMMTSIPTKKDGTRPLISFNETYIRDSAERNCFLHFGKIIHAYGHILTLKVMKHVYSQQGSESVSSERAETPTKVGMIWSSSLGKEIGDCGSAAEESLFGGRVVVATRTAKYFSKPLGLDVRHFKTLCLGEGNTKTFSIPDEYISQILNQLREWTTGTRIPNLEIPQGELISGSFAPTEQEAMRWMGKKRKRAANDCYEENFDYDNYDILVDAGLAPSAEQARLCQEEGRKLSIMIISSGQNNANYRYKLIRAWHLSDSLRPAAAVAVVLCEVVLLR